MKKRKLDFRSGDEVIDEIRRLQASGYNKTKRWNLTQICEHLQLTMAGAMDGFGFRIPWILRATVVKWVFAFALKTRFIAGGAPTFRNLKPELDATEDDPQLIEECVGTIKRAMEFEGSLEDYPLLDNLSVADWQSFMWLHAAHHLSYLVPKSKHANESDEKGRSSS